MCFGKLKHCGNSRTHCINSCLRRILSQPKRYQQAPSQTTDMTRANERVGLMFHRSVIYLSSASGINLVNWLLLPGSLYPTSMRISEEGRLVVNFKTEARFHGLFVMSHPGKLNVHFSCTMKTKIPLPNFILFIFLISATDI